MKTAFGLKAHSGWAALVVIGLADDDYVVADRRRIELVDEVWQKAPYHAAEDMESSRARRLVERGIAAAKRGAVREMQAAIDRERARKNRVFACGALVVDPMPAWTVEQILAVHFRMHKAEGVLFREVLVEAAKACKLKLVPIQEKHLKSRAESTLGWPLSSLEERLTVLGKSVGPPWGRDQKDAALAAMIALHHAGTVRQKHE